MNALKGIACRMAVLVSAGILLCAGSGSAQTFETVHGGVTCPETGRSVVIARQGGYLALGETFSKRADCSEGDIYLRRVSDDGRSLWGMWYDFGGDEYATSIKEVFSSPTGQDGFIITGVTQGWNNPCWTDADRDLARALGWYDIFLLRIDYCGNVLWCRTYGTAGTTEVGWDVIEAQQNGAGDLIVAGTTTFPNQGFWNPRNGYLLRVNGVNGGIIWDAYYAAPQQGDDNFYALDETQSGNIVAAGSTDSYGNYYQGWLVLVKGANGQLAGQSATYGGPDFEEFRSVQDLTISSNNIVAVGTTHSLTSDDEVYLVETGPNVCDFVGDVVFGNFGRILPTPSPSGGYGVREIPFNGPYYGAGELIVTGYSWNINQPRQEDVFLQVVTPGRWTSSGAPQLNGPMGHYGGITRDGGFAVEPVDKNTSPGCRSDGFIVTGFTQSRDLIGNNDQAQLYLLKTDERLNSICTEDIYEVPWKNVGWGPECHDLDVQDIGKDCEWRRIKSDCMPGACRYCYCSLDTRPCEPGRCDNACWDLERKYEESGRFCRGQFFKFCDRKLLKNLTGSSIESSSTLTALGTMPNPVKKGDDLTLNYMLGMDAEMMVSVSDMSGREVHSRTVNSTAGEGSLVIGTQGWSAGGYVVSVKIGKDVTTTRMVVTE